MAQREASIRLTIKQAGFVSGLNKLVSQTAAAGTKMGAAIGGPMKAAIATTVKAGIAGAGTAMKNMVSGIGTQIKGMATLGGAFAVGKFLNDAMQMQAVYRDIAHNVNKIPGQMVSWKDIQSSIEPIADATGQKTMDMANAFNTVFGATGDLEYTKRAMQAIGTAATASGQDATKYAEAMQLAFRKFGVTADETEAAIAAFNAKIGIGGMSIDDLNGRFAVMAGEAANAGMKGVQGMNQLLGIMLALDSSIGEKAAPGLKAMFQYVKNNTSQLKKLEKDAKIKFEPDMTAFEKIRKMLETEKGRTTAQLTFTADSRVVYDTLAQPFEQAYKEALDQGVGTAEATKIGLKAFDESIKGMSRSGKDFTQLQEEANDRMKEDPTVAMREAFNKMATAFNDPKMMSAVTRLAKNLPPVAEAFAKLLGFIVDNPLMAAGGYAGGRMLLGFAQGALASAGSQIGAYASATINKAAPTTGAKIGLAFKAAVIAAAAYIGYQIGKAAIDAFTKRKSKAEGEGASAEARVAGAMGGGLARKEATLIQIRKEIAQQKAEKASVWNQAGEQVTGATDWAARTMGLMDKDEKGRIGTRADAIAKLEAAERELEAAIKRQREAKEAETTTTDRVRRKSDELATNMDKAAKAAQAFAKAGGKGGPPGSLPNAPGHDAPGG